jgi:hypothetical protein
MAAIVLPGGCADLGLDQSSLGIDEPVPQGTPHGGNAG